MPNSGGRWHQSLKRAFADSWRNRLFRGRSRGTYCYRCPEYLHAKSRETRRNRGLQGAGVAGARQSLRRSGGISAARSPLVHAVCRPWSRRRGCRRQNFVALPRGVGQGGRGGRAVRFVLEGQGRSRQGERWFQALFARREKRKARRARGAKGASGSDARSALDEEARALVFEP
jgi:hypothetical protein